MQCTCCGRTLFNEVCVSVKTPHNIIMICENCIDRMQKELKEINHSRKEGTDMKNEIYNILKGYLGIYLDFVNSCKEKENEPLPYDYAQYYREAIVKTINNDVDTNATSLTDTFNDLLRSDLTRLYKEHNNEDIPFDDFSKELTEMFLEDADDFANVSGEMTQMLDSLISHIGQVLNQSAGDGQIIQMPPTRKQSDNKDKDVAQFDIELGTPRNIKAELDKYVIGQEHAKKVISVAIYNHYKRIKTGKTNIRKSNIMLVGPTGVGKTEIARTVARVLDVPFVIQDATGITEAGYVGGDVEEMLLKLINACDGDIQKAEHGIIYIDEIDKLARSEGAGKDVSGEGVQQALLKIVEGSEITIPVNKRSPFGGQVTINTENILFICGGAFEHITMAEKKDKVALGFGVTKVEEEDTTDVIDAKALCKYGMIPELVGRFPVIVKLEDLTVDDLKRILVEPENSIISQYKELVGIDDIQLDFTTEALKYIANKAKENKTGARGLKSIIEDAMLDLMYELPDEKNVNRVQIGITNGKLDIRKENV